ncbi:hypothetical protein ACUXQE_001271 [Staphylococcus saprophyticus]|uniref:tubby C-terminal domain-like protein n=1 Tax=Staphylococcus saprophyticus TaxID=29385 RepID=UPI000853BDE4|nr:hypothetical protein [Staphylococcus saprophyticus]MBN6850718.1 hypothetical protein [Staphylococcus saprophyticus]MBU8680613.1 hypothetical protein [Staphylococcus saprophyticus]MDW3802193.1 hypothetical protein [Staphylococcus saprophyticus]MDW3892410.1 hypothetical protein [Staphylococcus saprophyticus]MDW3957475.1 hypothetical protein [Staphylococcus saprophyticus]
MTHYYFKENFFNVSSSAIEIYNDKEDVVFTIELFYTSAVQQTMAYLGNNKQNFEITDGQDTYRVLQEGAISGAIKKPFKTVWTVEKNNQPIGLFRSKMGLKPTMYFEGTQGDIIKFQSGFFSRSVKVTESNQEIMQTKSERFKFASRHDVYIETETYHPAMLILLFQVFYEFQEKQRKNAN